MEKRDLLFKENIEFKGKKYLAGFAYTLELEAFEFNRLTRMGCIYASKDAKYYQEEEKQAPIKKAKNKKVAKKEESNVDHTDIEQAEIQAFDSYQDEHNSEL